MKAASDGNVLGNHRSLDFNFVRQGRFGHGGGDFQDAVDIFGRQFLRDCTLGEVERALEGAVDEFMLDQLEFLDLFHDLPLALDDEGVILNADFEVLGVDAGNRKLADKLLGLAIDIGLNRWNKRIGLLRGEDFVEHGTAEQVTIENVVKAAAEVIELRERGFAVKQLGHTQSPFV